MKKTGRIAGVTFTTTVGIAFFLYYYFVIKSAWQGQAVGAVICSFIAWWLGGFYDKARYYAQELEQRTRELEQSKEELQYYFDSGNITIWEYEISGKVLHYSLGVRNILGMAIPDRYNLAAWAEAEFIHPEDKELFRSYVNDFLAGKVAKVKCRIIHTSGDVRWIESHANPIYKNGEFLKVIGSLTDITEEKISEEILRRSDKLHVIGEMASGVAHEIRNPLTTIKGFMQIIRPKIQEKHYVDTVLTEIERINQIVSEFMALAKPYAANFSPRNVMEMIRDTVNLLQPQLAMNSVQVSLSEETGEAPLVYCEENQIKQVFINIIKNAMEAMPDGGPISISVQRSGRYISIRISDQGCGIESHLLDKVGVPFHTTKENGTGLGLMVSGRIVENHKGSLTIQSVVNQGTTVTIVLPSA